MNTITGNEPSMPMVTAGGSINDGLTIRQQFAMVAMQGLLANNIYHNPNEKHKMIIVSALTDAATHYADALIESLNKPKP